MKKETAQRQPRTVDQIVRGVLSLMVLAVVLVLAPTASAETTICSPGSAAGQCLQPQGLATDFETGRLYVADQGNNRIDVFDEAGTFVMAFGWGVADGKVELQGCGPGATPPSASCRKGLAGGGAGEFSAAVDSGSGLYDIAVDNDPSSASHHDVYVLDGKRVQKFDPEGNFLLAFGGGVVTGGAKGTADLSAGSKEITGVQTTAKAFEAGQEITGAGIPAETKIVSVGEGTITLSKAAAASGTAVPVSVAEGPGNVSTNEIDTLVNHGEGNGTGGSPNFKLITPDPSPSESELGQKLPFTATAAELQAAFEALPNVGPGNVKVSGEKVDEPDREYTIEFTGTRFVDTDVHLEVGAGSGNRHVLIVQKGAGGAEVCPAAIAESCSGGVQGTGHGQLAERPHLAIGPGGEVDIADCIRTGPEGSGACKNRLQKFQPSGAFIEELALPQAQTAPNGLAVDSSGNFYVAVSDAIRKYGPAGNLVEQLPAGSEVGALTVDEAGNLFSSESEVGQGARVIGEYGASGSPLRRFGYGLIKSSASGLAPHKAPATSLFVAEGDSVIVRSFPPPGPILEPEPCKTSFLGNVKAVLQAEVNPEGKATTIHFEYVTEDHFEKEGFAKPQTTDESESLGSDFVLHKGSGEADLVPETKYRCRVVATNADVTVKGEEGTFTSLEPLEIGPTSVSDVQTEAATLNAVVNPLGITTTGYFQYVEEATYLKDVAELGPEHGFDHAAKAPAGEPLDFGASESFTVRSAPVSGLKPGTAYRYRVIATNLFFETKGEIGVTGPTEYLRTYLPGTEALPDERAWELVSPAQKNSAEVAVPGAAGGLFEDRTIRLQAGAGSGNAITYTSWTSFGQAESAPATNQYLSKRTAAGWETENISPYGFQALTLLPPYTGFSADLRFGALTITEPALVPGCSEDTGNLYLRDNETGTLHCLTPETPLTDTLAGGCFVYAGASEDGSRAFFAAAASYAGAPQGSGYSLYEWSAADGLRPLSVLPGQSEAVPPSNATSFGASLSFSPAQNCQIGQTTMRHVISADGHTAFWTYVPDPTEKEKEESKKPTTELLARINGEETIQLDAKVGGGKGGDGQFLAANEDGSWAFFTAPGKLNSEAGAAGQLYRYDTVERTLKDLTPGKVAPEIQGLAGVSDDGSYAYFVAKGVLTGEEEGAAGQKAQAGEDNLYLYREGEGLRFIATLADEDRNDWETQPRFLSARISPDGRHLAFLSIEAKALAGYDNTVAEGEHCQYEPVEKKYVNSPLCPQAFLYDAGADELTCASCNPSGARPQGPTLLPGWSNPYEGPRYLSDDGSKLFFESYDVLSLADENEKRDVYEFEVSGAGSCEAENPAFDPHSGGCHFLITSGKSTDESYLVDASSDGRDVFFSTRSVLTGWDTNGNYDIYDARAGGGLPEPSPQPVCQGEACTPPADAPPATPSPVTPNVQSPGNPPPQAKPHKHKKKSKHKAKKKHQKASHKGRAGR